jgi:hypothetical protein
MVLRNQRLVYSKLNVIYLLLGVWELTGFLQVVFICLVLKRALDNYLKNFVIYAVIVLLEHGYTTSVLFFTAAYSHLHLAFLLCSINLLFMTFHEHLTLAFNTPQRIQPILL